MYIYIYIYTCLWPSATAPNLRLKASGPRLKLKNFEEIKTSTLRKTC